MYFLHSESPKKPSSTNQPPTRKSLEEKENKFFELRNGVVYRKDKANILFWIPKEMIDKVISYFHDNVGHVGIDKTKELIMRSYWFPDMKTEIQKYITNCLPCIYYQPRNINKTNKLEILDKSDKPFETIHIDHYGPLSITKNKNRFL